MSYGKNLYVAAGQCDGPNGTGPHYGGDRGKCFNCDARLKWVRRVLDVEAKRQQIADIIDSLLVEYADILHEETGWPDSYAGDVPWEVRLDKSKYKIVDAVLRVCGLTQEESE